MLVCKTVYTKIILVLIFTLENELAVQNPWSYIFFLFCGTLSFIHISEFFFLILIAHLVNTYFVSPRNYARILYGKKNDAGFLGNRNISTAYNQCSFL